VGEFLIPGDEKRFAEEIAGVVRPPRPESLAGEYLTQAINALHDAGDPSVLFAHWRKFKPGDPAQERERMRAAGKRSRLRAARNAVLFAAFAGEAYVNEFLAAHGVLEKWDRKPTAEKYLKGTAEAYGCALYFHDRSSYPVLRDLYDLRNRLAHPKPGFGVRGLHSHASSDFAAQFALPKVAEYIVTVGGAADLLIPRAHGMHKYDLAGLIAWRGKEAIRDYARRNKRLPAWNAASERPLFRQAGDLALEISRRTYLPLGPDHPYSQLDATRRGRGEAPGFEAV
jgi:hypothetical protein